MKDRDYDYYIFVDASGDDGFKFDKCSSKCYVASSVIISKDDIEHNKTILKSIKMLMGAKEKDEVKYSKIRRHKKSPEIHKLIEDVKASAYSSVVFKEYTKIPIYLDTDSKALSSFSHVLAISTMQYHFADISNVSVLVVIDRMKTTEESVVTELLAAHGSNDIPMVLPNHKIIYRDSKAEGYELIQLSDIVAGLTRSYFENHNEDAICKYFWRMCPICKPEAKLCRKRKKPNSKTHNFYYLLPLYRNNPSGNSLRALTFEPVSILKNVRYLSCQK